MSMAELHIYMRPFWVTLIHKSLFIYRGPMMLVLQLEEDRSLLQQTSQLDVGLYNLTHGGLRLVLAMSDNLQFSEASLSP